jgi:hypothetical protein
VTDTQHNLLLLYAHYRTQSRLSGIKPVSFAQFRTKTLPPAGVVGSGPILVPGLTAPQQIQTPLVKHADPYANIKHLL